jgi:pilus assembly protein Flp/PilA
MVLSRCLGESFVDDPSPALLVCWKNPVPSVAQTAELIERRSFVLKTFASRVIDFLKKEDGPTAVEYAVMLALIIVVCIAAITTLGSNANSVFANVSLNTAVKSGS